MMPPKPEPRPDRVSLWRYMRLFRKDILSAQPARLYGAWMAAFRTPFFRSFLVNDPTLLDLVLKDRPADFPKSDRIGEGLRPLLGDSVFLTNGAQWERQRRIIDPAFEGGRLRETWPGMTQAAAAAVDRMARHAGGPAIDVEAETSHAAADVIFRTLFSIPIEDALAQEVFHAFRTYQRSQPILNAAAFVPLPRWMPRGFRRDTRASAKTIRRLIRQLTETRLQAIADGVAPDDLATKIMTTPDPQTGQTFSLDEMVDQVAIFFLAGHETSASALGWALYLLATHPDWQARVHQEAIAVPGHGFGSLRHMPVARDVFREALRLYPPVPMMVRETVRDERFRNRAVPKGAQIVLSPWHLHRHTRFWENPDGFDPARWQTAAGKASARSAFLPFSAGPRVCSGAGFAMAEGTVLLSRLVQAFAFSADPARVPVPQAQLTVRAKDGILLSLQHRDAHGATFSANGSQNV